MASEKQRFSHPAARPFAVAAALLAMLGHPLALSAHGFGVPSFNLNTVCYLLLGYGVPALALMALLGYLVGVAKGFGSSKLLSLYLLLFIYLLCPILLYCAGRWAYGAAGIGLTPAQRPFSFLVLGGCFFSSAALLSIIGVSLSYRRGESNAAAILTWLALFFALGGMATGVLSLIDFHDASKDLLKVLAKEYGCLLSLFAPFSLALACRVCCPKKRASKPIAPLEKEKESQGESKGQAEEAK